MSAQKPNTAKSDNGSPSSKGKGMAFDTKGDMFSVKMTKPLGLSIGDSGNGNMISNIDCAGNVAKWNEECESCEFDKERVIKVGDRVVGISAVDGKIVESGNWSPMQILDFFTYRTGPVVTLRVQRSNMVKGELQTWLKTREGRQVFEPMLLPLNLKIKVSSPLGLELSPTSTSTGTGAAITSFNEGGSVHAFNAEAKRQGAAQRFFNKGDMLVALESEGGAVMDLQDKTAKEVSAILDSQMKEFELRIRRPVDTKHMRPRTVVARALIAVPTGITFKPNLYGTVVAAIEGGSLESWNEDANNNNTMVCVGDYVIGFPKRSGDDVLLDLEGACHDSIITAFNQLCESSASSEQLLNFKFKRTFKK